MVVEHRQQRHSKQGEKSAKHGLLHGRRAMENGLTAIKGRKKLLGHANCHQTIAFCTAINLGRPTGRPIAMQFEAFPKDHYPTALSEKVSDQAASFLSRWTRQVNFRGSGLRGLEDEYSCSMQARRKALRRSACEGRRSALSQGEARRSQIARLRLYQAHSSTRAWTHKFKFSAPTLAQ